MDSHYEVALLGGLFIVADEKQRKRLWTKKWLLKRYRYGHLTLLRELQDDESHDLYNYLRMDKTDFQFLLNIIEPKITKKNTVMRDCISAEQRLVITLRYLATGRNYEDLTSTAVISPQRLGRIIPETCWEIYRALKKDFMKFPTTTEEWLKIEDLFKKKYLFNHCLGAIDGKHIEITKPPGSGSYFYNYKGFYSIILMAVVNANYEFIYVNTGMNGRVHDSSVLQGSDFYGLIENNSLNEPPPNMLPGIDTPLPYVFVADSAFASSEKIMKLYPNEHLTREKKVFNYRLSRARVVRENCFGIMTSRFRVLLSTITVKNLNNIDGIVLACCSLHNFLWQRSTYYITPTYVDHYDAAGEFVRGTWREEVKELYGLQNSRRREHDALANNGIEELSLYFFNNECHLPSTGS